MYLYLYISLFNTWRLETWTDRNAALLYCVKYIKILEGHWLSIHYLIWFYHAATIRQLFVPEGQQFRIPWVFNVSNTNSSDDEGGGIDIVKIKLPYWPLFAQPLEAKLISKIWPWGPGKMRPDKLKDGQSWTSLNFLLKIIGHVWL